MVEWWCGVVVWSGGVVVWSGGMVEWWCGGLVWWWFGFEMKNNTLKKINLKKQPQRHLASKKIVAGVDVDDSLVEGAVVCVLRDHSHVLRQTAPVSYEPMNEWMDERMNKRMNE